MKSSNTTTVAKLWTNSFILFTLSNLMIYLNLQMITPSLPAFVASELHGSQIVVSMMISVFALSAILTRFFIGSKLATLPRKKILLIGLLVYCLASLSYYFVDSFALLIIVRLVAGFSFGLTSTIYATIISDIIPLKRMGEGMGYFGLSTSLSMAVAPVLGLWMLNDYGFHALVIAITALIVIVLPLTVLIRFPSMERVSNANVAPKNLGGTPQGGKGKGSFDPAVLLPSFLNLLLSINYGGIITFIVLFGLEKGLANVGWFFLFNAGCILLVRPISGKLFDRKGHISVIPIGAVFVFVGMILLSYTGSMGMLIISAICFGIGYGMLQPSLQAWTIQRVPASKRGVANGMFFNSIDLGIAIGSLCLGAIATISSYSLMFRISSVTMVVFIIIYGLTLVSERKLRNSRSFVSKVEA